MANVHELRRNVRNIYCIALSPNQNTSFFENNNASLCVCLRARVWTFWVKSSTMGRLRSSQNFTFALSQLPSKYN